MANDLTKRAGPTAPKQAEDAASRLKSDLMRDALGRMFGEDGEKTVPGTPRVILALANHAQTAGWDRAKVLQREMFQAAAGSGLEMKFAFYGADNAAGVRRCRITTRWITDPDDMAGVMDRAECNCGCYVNIRDVLAQAVKEAEERPLRAVIIVGDAFHDDPDGLDEAAISANRAASGGDASIPDAAGRRSSSLRAGSSTWPGSRAARISGSIRGHRNGNSRRCGRQCRPSPRAARRP